MRLTPLLILLLLAAPASASHSPCAPSDCVVLVPIIKIPYLVGTAVLDHVQVDIDVVDGLAQTHLTLAVHNAGGFAIEEKLALPLPPGATLTAFNLTIDNKTLAAVVQEKGVARATYEAAKSQGRDAALLERADAQLMQLSVNIPAGANRTLRASYAEWVPVASGSFVYRMPLAQLALGTGSLDATFHLRDKSGANNLWSPAERMQFEVNSGTDLTGTTHVATGPLSDLVLVWQPVGSSWRASLIASQAPGPGATDVPAIATLCLQSDQVVARDVVFVLDRSGSMSGAKITQARESLRAALLGIRPEDHYNIIVFDDHVEPFIQGLTAGLATEVSKDRDTLGRIGARGGTDIDGALQEAMRQLDTAKGSGRIPEIVFVTDGLPSAGVTDTHLIITRARDANDRHAAIHVVPIGLDADAIFLTDLALSSGGSVTPMDPSDPLLGARLERLYDTVGHALVGDVNVTAVGAQAWSEPLPAVAEDACLHVPLRADLTGDVVLHLTGVGASGPVDTDFRFHPADVRVEAAAANLWGHAEVERLLSKERIDGTSAELRKSIVTAAVLTQQLTPYTSWVIAEQVSPVQLMFSGPVDNAGGPPMAQFALATSTMSATSYASGTNSKIALADQDVDASAVGSGTSAPQTPGLGIGMLALAVLGVALLLRRRL